MENSQQQKGRQIQLTGLEIKLTRLAGDARLADPSACRRSLRTEPQHAALARTAKPARRYASLDSHPNMAALIRALEDAGVECFPDKASPLSFRSVARGRNRIDGWLARQKRNARASNPPNSSQ